MKKLLLAGLLMAPLLAYAVEPRVFEVEVREITGKGVSQVVSKVVRVECDTPATIEATQTTTFPTIPPQPGPKLEFSSTFLWSQCQDRK